MPLAALDRPRRTITDCTESVVGLSSHDRCSTTGSDIVFVSDSDHQGKVVVVVADDSRRRLVRLSTGSGPPEERVEWCRSADRSDEDESSEFGCKWAVASWRRKLRRRIRPVRMDAELLKVIKRDDGSMDRTDGADDGVVICANICFDDVWF